MTDIIDFIISSASGVGNSTLSRYRNNLSSLCITIRGLNVTRSDFYRATIQLSSCVAFIIWPGAPGARMGFTSERHECQIRGLCFRMSEIWFGSGYLKMPDFFRAFACDAVQRAFPALWFSAASF